MEFRVIHLMCQVEHDDLAESISNKRGILLLNYRDVVDSVIHSSLYLTKAQSISIHPSFSRSYSFQDLAVAFLRLYLYYLIVYILFL